MRKSVRGWNVIAVIGLLGLLGGMQEMRAAEKCLNEKPASPSAPPGGSDDCNGTQSGALFDVTTGNLWRQSKDIELSAGAGGHRLAFTRYATSRASGGTKRFGTSMNIKHQYQWDLVDGGIDPQGEPILTLHFPDGTRYNFTHVGSGIFAGPPSAPDRIVQESENLFVLERSDGYRYEFEELLLADGTHYYQLQRFLDSEDNTYTLTYDTSRRFKRVTEPAGRYVEVVYGPVTNNTQTVTVLASLATAPPEGVWSEISVSLTNEFRYFSYEAGHNCPVAEIEVYDENNERLSGTPFGASPAKVTGREFDKAFDGNTATYYQFVNASGLCGLDFGTPKRIGRIRFRPADGLAASMLDGDFRGSNIKQSTRGCIKTVKTSDGRSIAYRYQTLPEPTLGYDHVVLSQVDYGEGETASYQYEFFIQGLAPLFSEASEPRYAGLSPHMKFEFTRNTGIHGQLRSERDPGSGVELCSRVVVSDTRIDAVYGHGATEQYHVDAGHESAGLIRLHVNAEGQSRQYLYDGGGLGFLSEATNARGETKSYLRNGFGAVLSETHADGSTETFARDGRNRIMTHTDTRGGLKTFIRDAQGRPGRIDHPDGSYETFTYNAFGEVLTHRLRNGASESFTYDTRGLKTAWTDAAGGVWHYTYDACDRLASATDPRGNATAYQYTLRGKLKKVIHPDGTFVVYLYDSMGNRTAYTDETGRTWNWLYDEFRRVHTAIDPMGHTTRYGYGPVLWNSGSKPRLAGPTEIVSPEWRRTEIAYDPLLRRSSVIAGAESPDAATTSYGYDPVGNLETITDPNGQVWRFEYDGRNRRTASIDPLGNRWAWSYDRANNRAAEIRPDGGVTTNVFDAMRRLVGSTDPAGNQTVFGYDEGGRLVSLTDARNNTHSFEYDPMDRRTAMIYPGGSAEEWSYDPAGNVDVYTTRAGQTLAYTYDSRNREVFADWSDATPDVARTYDAAGRLTTVSNAVSVASYQYDPVGRLSSETTRLAGSASARSLAYGYNEDGLRSGLVYPDGSVVDYAYTARGQIASITADGSPPLATFAYDPAGNRISKSLENGRTTAYAYDAASRLTQVAHNGVITLDYALNAVGNRTSRSETVLGGGTFMDAYSYDDTDQLTGVDYGSGRQVAYQYDPLGNRERVADSVNGTTTYAANNLNQYTAISGQPAPAYDANGNLIGRAGWVYTYDAQNRLVDADGTLAGAGARMTFAYDGLNRCVARKLFTWDGAAWALSWERELVYDRWSLVAEFNDVGSEVARYVHGPRIDEILARIDAAGTVFYHHDGLGSTVALTDETSAVLERYRYDAFGAPEFLDASGVPIPLSAVHNRFLFAGRDWLAQVGLYDYRYRAYDPRGGRFLQTDPVRFAAADANLYRYVSNGVANLTDPLGLDYHSPWFGGGSIHGYPPQAWAGDGPNDDKRSGPGTEAPPSGTDVDFVKVNDEWRKIRGPVYIDPDGDIWGWDREATDDEVDGLKNAYPDLFEDKNEGGCEPVGT